MSERTPGHTPTPWRADEPRKFAGVKWDNIIRSARRNDPVCSVFVAGYMEREAKANADFIVTACNDYDEAMLLLGDVPGDTLVERVKRLISYHLGLQAEFEARAALLPVERDQLTSKINHQQEK